MKPHIKKEGGAWYCSQEKHIRFAPSFAGKSPKESYEHFLTFKSAFEPSIRGMAERFKGEAEARLIDEIKGA